MSTQEILDVMEQQQQIEAHGWQMFKDAYHRKQPPPILEKQAKDKTNFVFYAMVASAIGAFIVGGLQTIPSFYIVLITADLHWTIASIGGVSGFFAIDVGMFAASYYLIQTRWRTRGQNDNSFDEIVKLIRSAQIFGFIVSVATNFYFVFFAYRVNEYIEGSETSVTLFVAVLIALAPAIQGWAIGSVIAALPITKQIESLRVERRNQELSSDYEKARRNSWDKQKKKYGVVDMSERIERLQDEPVNTVQDSLRQSISKQTLNKKTAMRLIEANKFEYKSLIETVLADNPTATQKDISEAISESMTGEITGYKTVIRAYKQLGIEL
jgi:hypothetical protein